jgi:two-component system, sensor histidine kinase and response regulator
MSGRALCRSRLLAKSFSFTMTSEDTAPHLAAPAELASFAEPSSATELASSESASSADSRSTSAGARSFRSGDAHNSPGLVLIVDDVAANVRLLASILKIAGFNTITAESGPQALEMLKQHSPDIMLLDVMMPEMDGFEVCRHVRSDPATEFLPVVMVTALHGTQERLKALEVGADDFLTKPVDNVEVVARVKSLLRVKRQQDALTHAYQELKRLESLRDSLTMMLVHDLRTPLTTLIGPLEMLQNGSFGDLGETQQEIVAMSTRSGHRLLGLVNELLDVAKMESGELKLNLHQIQVAQIITEATEMVARVHSGDTTRLTYDIAPDLPPILADEDLLRRVVINLVGNALKYTTDGAITVGARRGCGPVNSAPGMCDEPASSNAILLWVQDEGDGIPPEDQERIFDKWGQAQARREGRRMSTGLGLTFCKLAVEAHGGHIWVESEPGQGATFFLTLPLEVLSA